MSRIALLAVLVLAACAAGRDTDEEETPPLIAAGLYRVTSHLQWGHGCEGDGEAVTDGPLFVKLEAIINGMVMTPCTDEATCAEDSDYRWSVSAKRDGYWDGGSRASSWGGDSCSLTWGKVQWRPEGGYVVLEAAHLAGFADVTEAECKPDIVEAHAADFGCGEKEVLKLERVGLPR